MAKTQKKSPAKPKTHWRRYITIAVVMLALGVPAYQGYQDSIDKKRFVALQSDFKKLQTEFNKIDPGWEYDEGCSAPHFVSSEGPPNCEIAIYAKNKGAVPSENKTHYIASAASIIGTATDTSSPSFKTLLRPEFTRPGQSICEMSLGSGESKAYVRCNSEARDFYFTRTDK